MQLLLHRSRLQPVYVQCCTVGTLKLHWTRSPLRWGLDHNFIMFFQPTFFRIAQTPNPLLFLKWEITVSRKMYWNCYSCFSILKWPEPPPPILKDLDWKTKNIVKLWSDPLVLCYQVFFMPHIYRLRSLTQQGNNALGSISLSVNPSVLSHMNRLSVHLGDHLIINHEAGRCLSVCLSVHPSIRVCVCVLFTLKQKWLLPVQDFVCNLGALADTLW